MHRGPHIAILFVVLLCTLAPQWMALVRGSSGSLKLLHVGALAFVLGFSMLGPGLRLAIDFASRTKLFYALFALYLVFVGLPHAFGATPHFPLRELIRQVAYGGVSLWVGALFLVADRERVQRVLVWSCPCVLATFFVTIGITLVAQGVDPLAAAVAAVKQANPNIIMWRVFRSAFLLDPDAGLTAAANLRHAIMSTILTGVLITLSCRPRGGASRSSVGTGVIGAAVVLSLAVVVFSLSRSAVLMCVLIGLVWVFVFIARQRVTLAGVYAVLFVPLLLVVLVLSPVGDLMYVNLFERTQSYSGRLEAMAAAITLGGQNLLLGSTRSSDDANAHNLVLDALVGGGLPAAAVSALALIVVLVLLLRTLARVVQRDGWLLAVRGEFVIGLGIVPVVRFLTAARGTLHLSEWVALAAFLGIALANEAAYRSARGRALARGASAARGTG